MAQDREWWSRQLLISKITSSKLRNLLKITNLKENNLLKILSYEIDVPIKTSSKLMNSKIGKVFLIKDFMNFGKIKFIAFLMMILENEIRT